MYGRNVDQLFGTRGRSHFCPVQRSISSHVRGLIDLAANLLSGRPRREAFLATFHIRNVRLA
jgi:hypothetical protein